LVFEYFQFPQIKITIINQIIIFCRIIDEEIGGILGMAQFVKTDEFRSLNIGFTLDEGLATIDDVIPLFYGEKTIWRQYILQ